MVLSSSTGCDILASPFAECIPDSFWAVGPGTLDETQGGTTAGWPDASAGCPSLASRAMAMSRDAWNEKRRRPALTGDVEPDWTGSGRSRGDPAAGGTCVGFSFTANPG